MDCLLYMFLLIGNPSWYRHHMTMGIWLFFSLFKSTNCMVWSWTVCEPQAHGAWISFPPPLFFLLSPLFFQNVHNHSFFKIFMIIRFSSFDNIMNNTCILYPQFFDWYSMLSVEKLDTEYTYYSWCMTSTDIGKWRKTNYHEHFEKWMIMKILEKRG